MNQQGLFDERTLLALGGENPLGGGMGVFFREVFLRRGCQEEKEEIIGEENCQPARFFNSASAQASENSGALISASTSISSISSERFALMALKRASSASLS